MTLRELMEYIYVIGPFSTRGNTARENAEVIAEGAIRGFLSTQFPDGTFGNSWHLTALGVHELGMINPPLKDLK